MPIEHIRLSKQAREQLIKLKRWTGLQHWNELSRWAFCLSLADPTKPAPVKIPADGAIEMTWRVFAGNHPDVYLALLKSRCERDGLGVSEETLATQFRLHLHRGIGFLAADRNARDITDLIKRVQASSSSVSSGLTSSTGSSMG